MDLIFGFVFLFHVDGEQFHLLGPVTFQTQEECELASSAAADEFVAQYTDIADAKYICVKYEQLN